MGFVHTGHERSFVYDIADLYKAELSIPVAFRTTAAKPDDIGAATRKNMRDALYDLSIMKRIVSDITHLLMEEDGEADADESDELWLWDEKLGEVAAGTLYADAAEGDA